MFSKFEDNCLLGNSSALLSLYDVARDLKTEDETHIACLRISPPDLNSLQSLLLYKISPYVILIITCTNTLVCIVLSRTSMISPTNIILLAIAVSDMLTGLFPFPIYVLTNVITQPTLFTKSNSLAYINFNLTTIFPTTFHTASVFLTITLAFQRVIYVRFPTLVTQLCTNRISVITTVFIFFLAFLMHSLNYMYRFESFFKVCRNNETMYISATIVSAHLDVKNYSNYDQMMKCSIFNESLLFGYTIMRIILLHVVPCILLTILTTLILIVLKQKSNLSKRLLVAKNQRKFTSAQEEATELSIYRKNPPVPSNNVSSRTRCKDSSSSTSKMLVVVLLIFLSVEIPMGFVITLYVIGKSLRAIRDDTSWLITTNVCNFLTLISYPFNFVIYCIMSKKFRDTFKETLCPDRLYNIISISYTD